MESNDSPEIPDREETSDIPGLPSGGKSVKKAVVYMINITDAYHRSGQFACGGPKKEEITARNWNCLLYTSPSPRDFCRSRMPSSA